MHKVLEQQIKRLGKDPSAECGELLKIISQTYEDFDAERNTLERSVEVGSQELAQVITLLRATINSVDEGILVLDKGGAIVNFNKRFVEIWQIPEDVMQSRDAEKKVALMTDSVVDPVSFQNFFFDPAQLQSKKNVSQIIHLKNGKTLDIYSNPQIVKGKKNGRVCIFRDITQHFRAEEALRQKIDAMERLNKVMVDRELKMVELKEKIKGYEMQKSESVTHSNSHT